MSKAHNDRKRLAQEAARNLRGTHAVADVNASGEAMTFLCIRTDLPTMVSGSHRMTCDGCRSEVWMSPATKATFDKIRVRLIVCIECAAKTMNNGA